MSNRQILRVKMAPKKPVINKCCAILPNRFCIVVIALLKIIAEILGPAYFGSIATTLIYAEPIYWHHVSGAIFVYLALVLDVAFMIVMLVGACSNNQQLYKLSYRYSITSLVVTFVLSIGFLVLTSVNDVYDFYRIYIKEQLNVIDVEYYVINSGVICIYALIHILIILLNKSEFTRTSQNVADNRTRRTSQLSYGRFD